MPSAANIDSLQVFVLRIEQLVDFLGLDAVLDALQVLRAIRVHARHRTPIRGAHLILRALRAHRQISDRVRALRRQQE